MPPRLLSYSVAQIATQALDRKAAQLGALLGNWEAIVGKSMASVSFPVRIAPNRSRDEPGATLYLAVPSAWKTEFQHEMPRLLNRINAFFGHQAIREIRLSPQQKKSDSMPLRHTKKADSTATAETTSLLATVEDPELRQALAGLHQAMRDNGV